MICKRCLNQDINYFYKGTKGYYCRKCVSFKRILLEEDIDSKQYNVNQNCFEYEFKYKLTDLQKDVSKQVLNQILSTNVLLKCVCGSGKTEIVVETISYFLKCRKKVCFSSPRKEVVIELSKRFQTIFKDIDIATVYGSHTSKLFGDLIVCTSHQLFRYYKTFDLLIIDEADGFPLNNNETLFNISLNSCKSNIIFSTATTTEFLLKQLKKINYKEINLYTRPSYKEMVEGQFKKHNLLLIYIKLLYFLITNYNQAIIFVERIDVAKALYHVLKNFFSITYVYSSLEERDKNINGFRDKKYKYIISTSVLERGVTIKDIDVLILNINNTFEKSCLIQMMGRVGRNVLNPYGKCIIYSTVKSKNSIDSIKEIKYANNITSMYLMQSKNKQS